MKIRCVGILIWLAAGVGAWGQTISSVMDAFSGVSGVVAPGEELLIKGSGLASSTTTCYNPAAMAYLTSCGNTTVLVGNYDAAIQQISPTLLTVFVPYEEVNAGIIVNIYVTAGSSTSPGFQVTVTAAVPYAGGFYKNGVQVSSGNPASAGDMIKRLPPVRRYESTARRWRGDFEQLAICCRRRDRCDGRRCAGAGVTDQHRDAPGDRHLQRIV